MAFLNSDNTVKLWTVQGGLIGTLTHNGSIKTVAFSPEGDMLASSSADNTVKLWHSNGSLITTLRGHSSTVNQVAFSPDGQTLVSASDDHLVQLWQRDGTKLKTLQSIKKNKDASIGWDENQVGFSADGAMITFVGQNSTRDDTVKLWQKDGQLVKNFQKKTNFNLKDITFSSDGKTIVWMDIDPALKLWDIKGNLLATLRNHQDWINDVGFSPNGKLLASVSDDKTVKLWNIDGRLLHTLHHTDKVNSVSFSPDGMLIVSASDDKTLKLWNMAGKLLHTLRHTDKVNSVSFSPDGKTFVSASDDKTVKVWSPDGKNLKTFTHTSKVKGLRFSPDSKLLASGDSDNTIKLWQINTGKEIIKPIEFVNNSINDVDFSPDNQQLAVLQSRYYNPSIYFSLPHGLWFQSISMQSGSRLFSFKFSPDGKSIATAGMDGVSLLDFDLEPQLVKACNLVRDYLKNNSKVDNRDRHLCDDIKSQP
jgi:WD40 repeat protein